MPTGDFPPPKGMRWTDAHGWVPDLPEEWGLVGGKPFKDEILELTVENKRLMKALAVLRDAAVYYMASVAKPSLRAEADGKMIKALDLSRKALAD